MSKHFVHHFALRSFTQKKYKQTMDKAFAEQIQKQNIQPNFFLKMGQKN
jgi:hypothetical protein